jgi:hypothetical protein
MSILTFDWLLLHMEKEFSNLFDWYLLEFSIFYLVVNSICYVFDILNYMHDSSIKLKVCWHQKIGKMCYLWQDVIWFCRLKDSSFVSDFLVQRCWFWKFLSFKKHLPIKRPERQNIAHQNTNWNLRYSPKARLFVSYPLPQSLTN